MREFLPLPDRVEVLEWSGDRFEPAVRPRLVPGDGELVFQLLGASLRGPRADRVTARPRVGAMVGELAAVGDRIRGWDPLDRAAWIPGEGPPVVESWFRVPAGAVRRGTLIRIPREITVEQAALWPSVAVASRALREARFPGGGIVTVAGLGLVGQLLILLARHQKGGRVIAADPSATQRRRAEWSGAERVVRAGEESLLDATRDASKGHGADLVVLETGDGALAADALRCLAPGGTVIVLEPPGSEATPRLPVEWVWMREARVLGVARADGRGFRDGLAAFRNGILDPDPLTSLRTDWAGLSGRRFDPETWLHGLHGFIAGPED